MKTGLLVILLIIIFVNFACLIGYIVDNSIKNRIHRKGGATKSDIKAYLENAKNAEKWNMGLLKDLNCNQYEVFKKIQTEDFRTRNWVLKAIVDEDNGDFGFLIRNGYKDVVDIVDAIIDPQNDKIIYRGARKLLQALMLYMFSEYDKDVITFDDVKTLLNKIDVRYNNWDNLIDCHGTPEIFRNIEVSYPNHVAVRLFNDFKKLKHDDLESVLFVAHDSISEFTYGRIKTDFQFKESEKFTYRFIDVPITKEEKKILSECPVDTAEEIKNAIDIKVMDILPDKFKENTDMWDAIWNYVYEKNGLYHEERTVEVTNIAKNIIKRYIDHVKKPKTTVEPTQNTEDEAD